MPLGAEVFTISGAAAPAAQATPAAQLQNALRALGNTNGDPKLAQLAVDGVIGPKTVAAVNYALATYVGGTPAFPRADLDVTKVRQFAGKLAALVSERVKKSGGSVPAPVVTKAISRRAAPPALFPVTPPAEASMFPPTGKWVWYVVGGVSVLIVLSIAAATVKKVRAK
jgi:peptidoglycan hydrolase-like protein with peptidoglycan-binding domain